MTYSFIRKDKSLHVRLTDSVDLSQTQSLKNEFEELISQEIGAVFINAEDLTYVDSSGVAALLYIRKACMRVNARFNVETISEAGYRVAQLAKLEGLLGLPKPQVVQASIDSGWNNDVIANTAHNDNLELSSEDVKDLFDNTFIPPAPPTYSGPVAKPPAPKTTSNGPDEFDIKPGSFS